jgi:RNA polymerase sigma factor (sigma-70 family)
VNYFSFRDALVRLATATTARRFTFGKGKLWRSLREKLAAAMVGAEISLLAMVRRFERRLRLIHLHPADRVNLHNSPFTQADEDTGQNLQSVAILFWKPLTLFSLCLLCRNVEAMANDASTALLENLDEFVAFARARVGDPELAADVVQDTLLKAIKSNDQLRDGESARAWFYRILRHTIIDLYRRRDVEQRALKKLQHDEPDPAETNLVCHCLDRLIPQLKPEYAALVRAVDLEEKPVEAVAKQLQITTNNASVRLHRARQQLRDRLEQTCKICATHGCLDCTCESN